MLIKLEWLGYRTVKKLWQYVEAFSSDTGTLRPDGRSDGQTDLLYQYCASVCWHAIKTVKSAEYTCQSQQCKSTNSAAILGMEIKHVAAYYFLKTINGIWISGVCTPKFTKRGIREEQPSMLNKFFSELQYSAAFGRESSLRVGSENTPNFVTFWPTL